MFTDFYTVPTSLRHYFAVRRTWEMPTCQALLEAMLEPLQIACAIVMYTIPLPCGTYSVIPRMNVSHHSNLRKCRHAEPSWRRCWRPLPSPL